MRKPETEKKSGESLLKFFGGDFPVFLLFLLIALLFWLSRTMNSQISVTVRVPVTVTGIPEDIRVTHSPQTQVAISVSGRGMAVRKLQSHYRRQGFEIGFGQFISGSGHAGFPTQALFDSIPDDIARNVSVIGAQPDTVRLEYLVQEKRNLPLVSNRKFENSNQYVVESVSFFPDSVWAYVPADDSTIHELVVTAGDIKIETDSLSVEVGIDNQGLAVPLTRNARMVVRSQQYTEKKLEVPVRGEGLPHGYLMKTFPSKAVVVCWVKLSEYDSLNPDDFTVVIDYASLSDSDGGKACPRVVSKPAGVSNVRLQTAAVDYLLEKNLL